MQQNDILRQMCHKELAKADMTAICKNRGFSSRIASSVNLLEGSFLSSTGVQEVMDSLTRDEVVLLHYLKYLSRPVDVSAFITIYGQEQPRYYNSTFNQRFKDVFNEVKKRLIRKGILLFAENKIMTHLSTRLERTLFDFPNEFHSCLPSIFNSGIHSPLPGENSTADLKQKLINDLKEAGGEGDPGGAGLLFSIQHGELLFVNRPFSMNEIRKWQRDGWQKALTKNKGGFFSYSPVISVMETVTYAMSFLDEHEWIEPGQLEPILKVFCGNNPRNNPLEICEQGWQHGCLNRTVVDGRAVYRSAGPESEPGERPAPDKYLQLDARNQVMVDPAGMTLEDLEILAKISSFENEDSRLKAMPNIIRMGREMDRLQGDQLFDWLTSNIITYKKVAATVRKRMGKLIVHKGIMVARVRDVTLRVAIKQAFDDSSLVFLDDEHIAFAEDLAVAVAHVVQKSGHVVKMVKTRQQS